MYSDKAILYYNTIDKLLACYGFRPLHPPPPPPTTTTTTTHIKSVSISNHIKSSLSSFLSLYNCIVILYSASHCRYKYFSPSLVVSWLLDRGCESDPPDHLLSFYTGRLSYVSQNWLHLERFFQRKVTLIDIRL